MRYAGKAATTGTQDKDCPGYFCRKCFFARENDLFDLLRA